MGGVNLKALSALLLAMVVSLSISNIYLYNRNYYGQDPHLVASNRILLQGTEQGVNLRGEGMGVNLRGERKTLAGKEGVKSFTAPLDLRLLKAETKNFSQHTSSSSSHTLSSSSRLQHNHTLSSSSHNHTLSSSSQLQHNHTLSSSSQLQHNHTLSSSSQLQHNHTLSSSSRHYLSSSSRPQQNHTPSPKTSASSSSGTHDKTKRRQQLNGYMAALKIYEQQTMATGNLMQLQCFASKLNVSIVQPFTKDSLLTLPLDDTQHSQMLRMEDVYDMQEWTTHAEEEGYAPLVTWEEFIHHAPRGVVLVQMKYPLLQRVKELRESGHQFPHPFTEERRYREGCGYKILDKAMKGLTKFGFHVSHKVCYNFLSGDEIPLEVYREELIRGHGDNVTIIIDEWRGLGEHQRVLLKERVCPESVQYRGWTHSSSGIERDARLYADKFLGASSSSSSVGYLAVIARYEMTVLTHGGSVIPSCLQETLKRVSRLRNETRLDTTFLSIDIGKYGSKSFALHGYYGGLRDMEAFVSDVYQGKMDVREWEGSFEGVVPVERRDAGYIAKVQQAVVARARCVLFVGGGTFQQNTLHLYQQLHPDPDKRCVHVVKKCTSPYRPVQ